jgi:aquaporin Z
MSRADAHQTVMAGLDPATHGQPHAPPEPWMPGLSPGMTKETAGDREAERSALTALRAHWPEYLMEAAGLGLFMVSAGLFGTLLWHADSPLALLIPDGHARRAVMGVLMGLTAIAIIYSPWGQQSGAHLNPAVTLIFWRLGKVRGWDALFYILAQFTGGALGVLLVLALLGATFADPPVSYVATLPGEGGALVALLAEIAISFVLMTMILFVSNTPRLMRLTGVFAGCLVALYITLEAPLSGMSMNPARTLASALPGGLFEHVWIYFTGPPAGMLLAALAYTQLRRPVRCAKLNHHTQRRCIFRCGYHSPGGTSHFG